MALFLKLEGDPQRKRDRVRPDRTDPTMTAQRNSTWTECGCCRRRRRAGPMVATLPGFDREWYMCSERVAARGGSGERGAARGASGEVSRMTGPRALGGGISFSASARGWAWPCVVGRFLILRMARRHASRTRAVTHKRDGATAVDVDRSSLTSYLACFLLEQRQP